MAKVATTAIWVEGHGRVLINASDFDAAKHTRYDGEGGTHVEEPVQPEVGDDPRYWIEENPPWFTVMGREEGKIGKATRDEGEANARLRDLIAEEEG